MYSVLYSLKEHYTTNFLQCHILNLSFYLHYLLHFKANTLTPRHYQNIATGEIQKAVRLSYRNNLTV